MSHLSITVNKRARNVWKEQRTVFLFHTLLGSREASNKEFGQGPVQQLKYFWCCTKDHRQCSLRNMMTRAGGRCIKSHKATTVGWVFLSPIDHLAWGKVWQYLSALLAFMRPWKKLKYVEKKKKTHLWTPLYHKTQYLPFVFKF